MPGEINPFLIIRKVEELYSIEHGSIVKKDRRHTTAEARAVAMYLVNKYTGYSLHEIADHFDRDHTTVIYNIRKIDKAVYINSYKHSRINKIVEFYEENPL